MSTDDDFTAYVGTHWSMLVRSTLLLGCATDEAESVVQSALVRSYPRWTRVWQDGRAHVDVLGNLLDALYAPVGPPWRGAPTTHDEEASQPPDLHHEPSEDDDGSMTELARILLPLPPLQRGVLVLRYVAELTESEAAQVLDVQLDTVRIRLRGALAAVEPVGLRGAAPVNESQFVDLVERHRQEQLMGLPPADLLSVARRTRARRRRRVLGITAAITGGVVAGGVLVAAAVHALGIGSRTGDDAAPSTRPVAHVTPDLSGSSTRLVGLNGWVVRVPAAWGTDLVGCDGSTPIRPSVVFDHQLPVRKSCVVHARVPYLRIGDETFESEPWGTVGGVAIEQRRVASSTSECPTCAILRVPSAQVSFAIRARTARQLLHIEDSLQPISDRQITVPVWRGRAAEETRLDQMTTRAIAAGLRPRVLEVASPARPGRFLRSDPPTGTPVDLGHGITLVYAAGDLDRVASPASLRRHGWRLSPVSDFQPPYGRRAATRAAGQAGRATAFLRTLTITHEGPRRVLARRRLAWLVVTGPGDAAHGHLSTITAVDAASDRVLETQTGFRGGSS